MAKLLIVVGLVVDQHLSLLNIHPASQQVKESSFACPWWTHDGWQFSSPEDAWGIFDDSLFAIVFEEGYADKVFLDFNIDWVGDIFEGDI